MHDFSQDISSFSNRPLEQRAHWYSSAAEAYDKARPRYPAGLIAHVAHLTKLNSFSRILEVGCGPGTATTAFAGFECPIVCVEPNPVFCELARKNCQSFRNVMIKQTSFEEWPVERTAFDVVVSASAFHWVQPEIGYPKAADALRDDGYLVLLWNKEPQPSSDVQQLFDEIHTRLGVSSPGRFETEATQLHKLNALAQPAIDLGLFKQVKSKQVNVDVQYTSEDYILLLSSFSCYLGLDEPLRTNLFAALRSKIDDELMGMIDLSYISAANIFQKVIA